MSITIGTVTISRNPSTSSKHWTERYNQRTQLTADAGRATYDNGPSVLRGVLVINGVSQADKLSLETYLKSTAIFGKNSFTITPPSNTDLGGGIGTALTSAYYDGGESDEGVYEMAGTSELWTITFPYWKAL